MLFCPICRKEFEPIYRFCPLDGKELVPLVPSDGTPPLTEINGRYRLVRELASDPVASLYEAEDRVENRPVRLTLFSPAFMSHLSSPERFRTEALLAKTVRHPDLAVLYGLDLTEDGRYFVVTEPISGVPLSQWLAGGPLSPAHAVAVLRAVGGALLEAHGQGLYHGYLTPHSIFVLRPDARPVSVKVFDCGIARFLVGHRLQLIERGATDLVAAAEVGYLAPELIGGEQESLISEQSDIYSFGIILYEALVGALPFQVETSAAMIDAHMLLEPVPMSNLKPGLHLPSALDDLVLRCLAKQPKKRFPSMGELLAALEPLYQSLEATLPASDPPLAGGAPPIARPEALAPSPRAGLPPAGATVSPSPSLGRKTAVDRAGDRPPAVAATVLASDGCDVSAAVNTPEKPATVAPGSRNRSTLMTASQASDQEPAVSIPPASAAAPSKPGAGDFQMVASHAAPGGTGPVKAPPPSGKNMKVIRAIISLVVLTIVTFSITLVWVLHKPKYGKLEIKTAPVDAAVYIDDQRVGNSPLINDRFPAGKHTLKLVKDGYQEWVKEFVLKPDSEQVLEQNLQPLNSSTLSPEQQRKVTDLVRKAELAYKENILIPPPDNYNALYFCDQILALDPANGFATDTRNAILAKYRTMAAEAFDQGRWFEAERHYQGLATLFPNDETIKQRLAEIAAKIEETKKDREKQVAELSGKIKQSLQAGALIPPEPDNALDNVTALLRINPKDAFARQSRNKILDLLRKRAENKIAASNFDGAKLDYLAVQRYFPNDKTAAARLDLINRKLAEASQPLVERRPEADLDQQRRARFRDLRQAGMESLKAGDFAAAIQSLEEARRLDGSDADVFYMLGTAYKERRQFDQAISNYQHAVSLNPNQGSAHFNLGRLYESYLHDATRAKQHYNRALQLGTSEMPADRLRKLIADLDQRERMAALETTPIPVIHKHLTGSCRGHLYLGGGQIRYETANNNDRFSEPLSNVAAEIKKDGTLSVQVIKGRRYNFQIIDAQNLALLRQRLGKEP